MATSFPFWNTRTKAERQALREASRSAPPKPPQSSEQLAARKAEILTRRAQMRSRNFLPGGKSVHSFWKQWLAKAALVEKCTEAVIAGEFGGMEVLNVSFDARKDLAEFANEFGSHITI